MKKTIRQTIAVLSFALVSISGLTGCSILKSLEKSCDVEFVGGDPFTTTHVSTFANGLTPSVPDSAIPDNHKFYGWTALSDVHFSDSNFENEYVKPNGIVKYQEIKDFIVDGKVTMKPLFINKDELPSYYLVVGWYAKTTTSGLDEDKMAKWTTDLHEYLRKDCGATDEQIGLVSIRAYNGDVATMGGLINADGDVDVLVGVGNNINSTAGVSIIEKQGNITMGGKSRYIARLTDKEVAIKVYEWLKTDAGHASLA